MYYHKHGLRQEPIPLTNRMFIWVPLTLIYMWIFHCFATEIDRLDDKSRRVSAFCCIGTILALSCM